MTTHTIVTDRDGREKVVLQAAGPELVAKFLAGLVIPDLTDMYGDPQRGFAGGYIVQCDTAGENHENSRATASR